MSKKDRCFCGSGRASRNCHNMMPNSRAAELFNITEEPVELLKLQPLITVTILIRAWLIVIKPRLKSI